MTTAAVAPQALPHRKDTRMAVAQIAHPTQSFGPPSDGPTADVVLITPQVAREWLKRNVHNRQVKDRVVAAYARDMAKGAWALTGEAIKFNIYGQLDDGQHRLAAIVRADTPVRMLVIWNIPLGAQAVMDSGVKRSVNDQLALSGVKNASILSAAARIGLSEPLAGFVAADDRITNPTNTELVAFINNHPDIHRAAEVGRSFYPAIDCQPSVLCLAWLRLSHIDLEDCSLFFHSVANMATDGPGDPRLALARRLQHMRRDGARRTGPQLLGLVYRSWNAWRRDKTLYKLPIAATIPERLY